MRSTERMGEDTTLSAGSRNLECCKIVVLMCLGKGIRPGLGARMIRRSKGGGRIRDGTKGAAKEYLDWYEG